MNVSIHFQNNRVLDNLTPLFAVEIKLDKLSFHFSQLQYEILLIFGKKLAEFISLKEKKFCLFVIILLEIQYKDIG